MTDARRAGATRLQNKQTLRTNGGFIQTSEVLILCNDCNKKQEKSHTCLLFLTSTNNGRHKVHLLHGGSGKVPGGLLIIQKVKKVVGQVLSERGDPFLAVFEKNLRK